MDKEEKVEQEAVQEKETKKDLKDKQKFKDEIAKLKADSEHWKNEYYRAYADMSNLRKSIEKDHQDVLKYRIEGFVEELLGVLDSFEFAFKTEAKTEEMKNYLTGFQYVYNSLINVLTNEGIEEIIPKVGDSFDPKIMHAVESVEKNGKEDLVDKVNLKGYKLHDHLIRPAMVVVTKHPENKDDENKKDSKTC